MKEGEEVILISDDGVIIRIPAEQITVQSRYAGGVRVMRIAEGGRVVSVETVPGSGDGDDEAAPEVEDAAAGNTADAE